MRRSRPHGAMTRDSKFSSNQQHDEYDQKSRNSDFCEEQRDAYSELARGIYMPSSPRKASYCPALLPEKSAGSTGRGSVPSASSSPKPLQRRTLPHLRAPADYPSIPLPLSWTPIPPLSLDEPRSPRDAPPFPPRHPNTSRSDAPSSRSAAQSRRSAALSSRSAAQTARSAAPSSSSRPPPAARPPAAGRRLLSASQVSLPLLLNNRI